MNRRAFLAGTTSILTVLGGCVSNSTSDSTGNTSTSNPTNRTVTAHTDEPTTVPENGNTAMRNTTIGETDGTDDPYFEMKSKDSEPQEVIAINHRGIVETNSAQRSSPSYDMLRIWNDNTDSNTVAISIRVKKRPATPLSDETYRRKSPENPILRKSYTIESDAYITLQLLKPGTYDVNVQIGKQTTETIEYLTDNCNSQSLKIRITPNGSIQSVQSSTAKACIRSTDSQNSSDG